MFQGSSVFKRTICLNLLPSSCPSFVYLLVKVKLSYVGITMSAGVPLPPSGSEPVLENRTKNKTYIQKTEPNQTKKKKKTQSGLVML